MRSRLSDLIGIAIAGFTALLPLLFSLA